MACARRSPFRKSGAPLLPIEYDESLDRCKREKRQLASISVTSVQTTKHTVILKLLHPISNGQST